MRIALCLVLCMILGCSHGGAPADAGISVDGQPDSGPAMCTRCDAVLNPCPERGLDCNPVTRCCVARAACVPLFQKCLAPATCCAGLTCVGGACAKVMP